MKNYFILSAGIFFMIAGLIAIFNSLPDVMNEFGWKGFFYLLNFFIGAYFVIISVSEHARSEK
jgi:hypothetical protein